MGCIEIKRQWARKPSLEKFNRNMGCIEIKLSYRPIVLQMCLIETWDVLK